MKQLHELCRALIVIGVNFVLRVLFNYRVFGVLQLYLRFKFITQVGPFKTLLLQFFLDFSVLPFYEFKINLSFIQRTSFYFVVTEKLSIIIIDLLGHYRLKYNGLKAHQSRTFRSNLSSSLDWQKKRSMLSLQGYSLTP